MNFTEIDVMNKTSNSKMWHGLFAHYGVHNRSISIFIYLLILKIYLFHRNYWLYFLYLCIRNIIYKKRPMRFICHLPHGVQVAPFYDSSLVLQIICVQKKSFKAKIITMLQKFLFLKIFEILFNNLRIQNWLSHKFYFNFDSDTGIYNRYQKQFLLLGRLIAKCLTFEVPITYYQYRFIFQVIHDYFWK